jgi:hypothetical protein
VGALTGVRVREHDLCPDLLRAANRFHEGIGGLNRHIHGLFRFFLVAVSLILGRNVVIENDRNLREPLDRIQIKVFERVRQLNGDYLRPLGEYPPPHFERKLETARYYRKIAKPAALETRELN